MLLRFELLDAGLKLAQLLDQLFARGLLRERCRRRADREQAGRGDRNAARGHGQDSFHTQFIGCPSVSPNYRGTGGRSFLLISSSGVCISSPITSSTYSILMITSAAAVSGAASITPS